MNANWILVSIFPLCASTLLAPLPQAAAPHKLARIRPQDNRPEEQARSGDVTLEDWKKKLTDGDLDRRESAFSDLVQRARENRELRHAIEQWSKASAAPELAWSARLALRELREPGPGHARMPGNAYEDLRRKFEQLERNFGGMNSLFDDLNTRFAPLAPGASRQSQSYSLQVGPDGVTLETTEDVGGNQQSRTYKAKDMQELLRNHPELRDRIGGSEHFDLRGAPGQNWLYLRDGQG